MSDNPIDEFLKRFDQLTAEQRAQLVAELEQRQIVSDNGAIQVKSLLEAFQQRGLIGSIHGAPADWSSNPDYLQGFGTAADDQ